MNDFTRLYWMRRFNGVRRFHAEQFQGEQTVGQHSSNVALILTVTVVYPSANLLKAAILHDLEEGETGDIPAPVKWSLGELALREVEAEIRQYYQFPSAPLSEAEERLLRAADFIDAVFTCLDQRMKGNLLIDRVFRAYQEYAAGNDLFEYSANMAEVWRKILAAYDHYAYHKTPLNPFIEEAERANFWKSKRAEARQPKTEVCEEPLSDGWCVLPVGHTGGHTGEN